MYSTLTPTLKEKVREISKSEFKTPDEIIQESIARYANDILSIKRYKETLALDFLEGRLGFDDFARIVGYDHAKELLEGKEGIKESVEGAKQDFKT